MVTMLGSVLAVHMLGVSTHRCWQSNPGTLGEGQEGQARAPGHTEAAALQPDEHLVTQGAGLTVICRCCVVITPGHSAVPT